MLLCLRFADVLCDPSTAVGTSSKQIQAHQLTAVLQQQTRHQPLTPNNEQIPGPQQN